MIFLICFHISKKDKFQILLESVTFFIVSFFSIILMLYLIRNEKKLQEHPILFSLIIYLLISLNHLIPLIDNSRDVGAIENGSFVLINIIVIYSILPLPKRITIALSALVSFTNLGILAFFLVDSGLSYSIVFKRVSSIFF